MCVCACVRAWELPAVSGVIIQGNICDKVKTQDFAFELYWILPNSLPLPLSMFFIYKNTMRMSLFYDFHINY